MKRSLRKVTESLLCLLLYFPATGRAAEYPEQPIRVLVGFGAGSPPDIVTRTVMGKFQTILGQTIVVENRAGASGTIALQELANQRADGYTLLSLASPTVSILSLYPNIRVNLAKDITPIGQIERDYNVLVVGNGSPAKSVAELISLLKTQPGKMNNASGGYGTPAHFVGELFKTETGTSAVHVPYAQFPQAVADVIAGRIDFMIMGAAVAVPQVQGGKLRALAVTSPIRLPALADVPTFREVGFPKVSVRAWIALVARSGTDALIIKRLNSALNNALGMPEVRNGLAALQSEPAGGTPEELRKIIEDDVAGWQRVVDEAKITVQ